MRDTIRKSANRYGKKGNGGRQPPKFEPRVRFNWGFHDAQFDAERKMPARPMAGHFDRAYAAGYVQGHAAYQIDGKRSESSEPAWQSHQTALAADQARKGMLPDNRVVRV